MLLNKIIQLESCESTNTYILKNYNNFDNGIVILTYNQTKGRGQRGNKWESEPFKNLTFSIKYDLNISINRTQEINNFVLNSVLNVLKKYVKEAVSKFPNDIYIGDKKICGILIENIVLKDMIQATVIGIGINVNQENFQIEKASSLKNFLKKDVNIDFLFKEILQELNNTIEKGFYLS